MACEFPFGSNVKARKICAGLNRIAPSKFDNDQLFSCFWWTWIGHMQNGLVFWTLSELFYRVFLHQYSSASKQWSVWMAAANIKMRRLVRARWELRKRCMKCAYAFISFLSSLPTRTCVFVFKHSAFLEWLTAKNDGLCDFYHLIFLIDSEFKIITSKH